MSACGLAFAICAAAYAGSVFRPLSEVRGEFRILPAPTALGEGALTVSRLDGGRTGYYYDLGERAGQLRPKAKQVVLLGLGGGEMLRAARRSLPKAELVGVDNDPRTLRAAVQEFHVERFGVVPIEADAFQYVRQLRGVDVLMVDLFAGDQMPKAMLEPGFWRDCRAAATASGLVVVNVYPESLVSKVHELLVGAGFRALERREVRGSTVLFGEL